MLSDFGQWFRYTVDTSMYMYSCFSGESGTGTV